MKALLLLLVPPHMVAAKFVQPFSVSATYLGSLPELKADHDYIAIDSSPQVAAVDDMFASRRGW